MDAQQKSAKIPSGMKPELPEVLTGYIPMKLGQLFVGSSVPCNLYFPAASSEDGKIRPAELLHKGDAYTEEVQLRLFGKGIEEVYIEAGCEKEFFDYFHSHVQAAINSSEVPTEKKTQLLYVNAEAIVEKVFRERPNASNLGAGKQLVEGFAKLVTTEEITTAVLVSLFSKDYYTFNHSVQVALLGMSFCNYLKWNKSDIADFGLGALFHDVGKNAIDEEILNKPGELDKEEVLILRQHPVSGYQQLKSTRYLSKHQLYSVLYHHEAMDGSGYPDKLAGEEIPLQARIVHIVDAFDALTSDRSYKKALTQPEALKLMNGEMSASFDPRLLAAFSGFIHGPVADYVVRESRVKAGIGTRILLQYKPTGSKVQSVVIGMDPERFIVLKIPDSILFQRLEKGMTLTLRYIYDGDAFGFNADILEMMTRPSSMIVISFPDVVERLGLRCERRTECFLPASLRIGEKSCTCVVVDLSYAGCKASVKSSAMGGLTTAPVNENVVLDIKLPGTAEAVSLPGEVKNVTGMEDGYFLGIKFTEPTGQNASHWRGFIGEIMELTG